MEKYFKTCDLKYYYKLDQNTQDILVDMCFKLLKYYPTSKSIKKIILLHNVRFLKITKYNITIYNENIQDPIQQLKRIGVVVLPIIDDIKNVRKQFIATLRSFPEYHRSDDDPDININGDPVIYVLGGFAALGNPSSFHNEFVRNLRLKAFNKLLPFFQTYGDDLKDIYLQCLVDRMMYRLEGQKPVAESWHRDVDESHGEGMIFGGWINLDTTPQYFSCIPGSHLNIDISGELDKGFATIDKALKKDKLSPTQIKQYLKHISQESVKFTIPPGHIIIFPQYILHNVLANKAKTDMMRLFVGWKLTNNPHCQERLFKDQAIIPLPGGMKPPMYSPNHTSYFLHKDFEISPGVKSNITLWFKNFHSCILVNNKLPRYMYSLKEYNLPLYPPYTSEEMKIYRGFKL